MRWIGLALAAGLALAGCRRTEPPLAAVREPGPTVADRVVVVSADALVVDGRHIRLSNAWAPQPIPRARCWAEALAARNARKTVRDMVRAARAIEVTPTGGVDDWNRTLARVQLDRLDLGETLHQDGLAGETSERFDWCAPISQATDGAPALRALYTDEP
jgi:hypothetical protein